MRFRKKPVVIEAMQFTGNNFFSIAEFMGHGRDVLLNEELKSTDRPVIRTLEGDMTAAPMDWIIKGVNGEFYPCKPDIFEKTYESLEG